MLAGCKRVQWAEAALVLLMAGAALPTWVLPYVPMQDYPQHLFQSKLVIAQLTGAAIDPHFVVHLRPSYSAFYVLVFLFSRVMGLAAAGRAAVTVYFVLAYVAARRVLWMRGPGKPAWAALALAPLAVNQAYYLGLLNFLLALPLVLIAWTDLLRTLRAPWTLRRLVMHVVILAAITLINAISLAMYLAPAMLWLLCTIRNREQRRRLGASIVAAVGCVGLWALLAVTPETGHGFVPVFAPLWRNAAFTFSAFTGYRLVSGPHWAELALWLIVLAAMTVRARARNQRALLLAAAGAGAILLITLLAPFSTGDVAYVFLRMAAGAYGLLVVAAAQAEGARWSSGVIAGSCAGLLLLAGLRERTISKETATLEPLIAQMAPGAAVYPWMWDPYSTELDAVSFEPHQHDVFYYQLAKGGVSPYLFAARSASGTPVDFAPGMRLPAPREGNPLFHWEEHGYAYRYILVRGGDRTHFVYLSYGARLIGTSGLWRLYERRASATEPHAAPASQR